MAATDPPRARAECDYIIVGSGAGGAPLAASLARRGFRVLVLEAGDWAEPKDSVVPALHALSTEDPELSWAFYVRHFSDDAQQQRDSKYEPDRGGVFYPRAATVGGCTVHNAMITIAGFPADWDDMAGEVGDDSWRGAAMRDYFRRVERCTYRKPPWFSADTSEHGYQGWLTTSWPDVTLALGDKELVQVLLDALRATRAAGIESLAEFARDFIKGRARAHFDPNDAVTQRTSPEGLVLIPTTIEGGRRAGPRDLLRQVQVELAEQKRPEDLTIQTNTLVTEIVFDGPTEAGGQPRAVGVKWRSGKHIYRADPHPASEAPQEGTVYCRREVILCGGTFNTPQLLMLSGIGPADELRKLGIEPRVDLAGVGKHLQDRYEIGVVWQMAQEFALLQGASFRDPAWQPPDAAMQEWDRTHTGVYATNGAVLGIMKKSRPDLRAPDLFIFLLPGFFRGYKTGYSKEIARQKNLLTWAILKAHTANDRGSVGLRSNDPLEPPHINFRSFGDSATGDDADLNAMVAGVRFVREIAAQAGSIVRVEELPGTPPGDDAALGDFVRREAWGHHACGTCRMGPDPARGAVVGSRFRVHGVLGLRVVDASIFPRIPGYFIVSHIYMIAEKAGDVIAEDAGRQAAVYPPSIGRREWQAIEQRRKRAEVRPAAVPAGAEVDVDSPHALGLALSGGGIRSATFNLGILQAMASRRLLRWVDYLSTVSGGGYIGGFLGRFFTRTPPAGNTTPDHVERALSAPVAAEVDWLRRHGNYVSPSGLTDHFLNAGIYVRNFVTLHLVLGVLLFGFFGLFHLLRYGLFPLLQGILPGGVPKAPADLPIGYLLAQGFPAFWDVASPWFMLVEVLLLVMVIPLGLAFWLAAHKHLHRFHQPALRALFLVAAVLLIGGLMSVGHFSLIPLLGVVPLVAALVALESAWHAARVRRRLPAYTGCTEQDAANIVANRLGLWLGWWLGTAGLLFAFALIDTTGAYLYRLASSSRDLVGMLTWLGTALVALLPVLRFAAGFAHDGKKGRPPSIMRGLRTVLVPWLVFVSVTFFLGTLLSFLGHWAYDGGAAFWLGVAATGVALFLSWILSESVRFINASSLQAMYAARLARAYLGATNPSRAPESLGRSITEVIPGDDVPLRDYTPHTSGGPLHLINTTINHTTDYYSQREYRERQGDNLTVGPFCLTLGPRDHALWGPHPEQLLPLGPLPGTEHVFPTSADELTLQEWLAISGAAIGPGRGRDTSTGLSLLWSLANLRTGYWWRTGKPFAPFLMPSVARWLRDRVPRLFLPQFLLYYEFIGRFAGPWAPYWYLSDGGFFENLGVYELVRRRVRWIVCCDAGQDGNYLFEDLANLLRKVRIDFGADIRFLSAPELAALTLPVSIRAQLGTLEDLRPDPKTKRSRCHAALAFIYYDGNPTRGSVLLYLKPSLTGDEPADITSFRATNSDFPHDPTLEQYYNEPQWESYRKLGEHMGDQLILPDPATGRLWLVDL
jgi:choline dehydrogenase-like flavoprotein